MGLNMCMHMHMCMCRSKKVQAAARELARL